MEEMVFKLGIEGLIGSVIGKPILTIRQENMEQVRQGGAGQAGRSGVG